MDSVAPLPVEKVLVVEDHAVMRRCMVKGLRRWGYEVYEADTVDRARDLMGQQHFDGIICDGILGDGLGLDLIRELRESKNLTPVLYVSAALTPQQPWERRFAFLPKPFDLTDLRAVFERVLGKSSS